MKKRYLPILFFVLLSLSSCFDIEERYDFKPDGSCNVVYNFDMSSAIAVLKNLMSDSLRATPQFSAIKDTTLNFYSVVPDSTRLKMSTQEADMAQASNLAIKMDLKKNIMDVGITHVAKSPAELEYYLRHFSKMSINKSITGEEKKTTGLDAQQLIAGEDYYSYEVTPHKFYRIIDKAKFQAFIKKTQSVFAMAKALLIETPYKLVLHFSHPVKRVSNPRAIVSADRKEVTLITNMDDVVKNPSIMNIKVDF